MFHRINDKHICILLHSLRKCKEAPHIYPELSIHVDEVDELIGQLKQQGYKFVLPSEIKTKSSSIEKTCSVTFDDGYFNNSYFLPIARKHNIPFVLFVSSYNIENQVPFIWDIMEVLGKKEWGFAMDHYQSIYEKLNKESYQKLMDQFYRPFTLDEILEFESDTHAYLGLHTHTHQPLIGKFVENIDAEIDKNLNFLSQFTKPLTRDFAFPNGLYNRTSLNKVKSRFDRIYTIHGGGNSADSQMVHRVSLLNPEFGGPMVDQIQKSFKLKRLTATYLLR